MALNDKQWLAIASRELATWCYQAFAHEFGLPYPADDLKDRSILKSRRCLPYWPNRLLHRLWLFYLRDRGFDRAGEGHSLPLFSRYLASIASGYGLARKDRGGEEPISDDELETIDRLFT